MTPLLSILTPAVPSRIAQLDGLCKKLAAQIDDLPAEHLVFLDNKRRSVGEKRDGLLRAARGQYVAYVDDDDDVSNDYVEEILNAINYASHKPDVVTFQQQAIVNDAVGIVEFKLKNPNEPFRSTSLQAVFLDGCAPPITRRSAWHVCAWNRLLAIRSSFPASNYGEDWAYAAPLCAVAQTEVHIPKILHYYRHDSKTTEAPPH